MSGTNEHPARLVSKQKLDEAGYFLDGLKDEQDLNHFLFRLSAFLTACHSVMDIMLYDLAERYGLGLTRGDWLDKARFALASIAHRNLDAQDFLRWWQEKMGILEGKQDSPWRFRNILTHRDYPELTTTEVATSIWAPFPEIDNPLHVAPYVTSHSGTIVFGPPDVVKRPQGWGSLQSRAVLTAQKKVFRFKEIPGLTAEEACRKLYEELNPIVAEAESKYFTS